MKSYPQFAIDFNGIIFIKLIIRSNVVESQRNWLVDNLTLAIKKTFRQKFL